MAITPISQYQGQDNSLAQILKGGQDTIAGILNSAIQLGRDRVNNQMRQENQMFQQRAAETALSQRRGENLTSLIQDSQRMTLNQMNTNRQYDRLDRQDSLNESRDRRSAEQNLFNNDLSIERLKQQDRRLDLQEELASSRVGGDETLRELTLEGKQLDNEYKRNRNSLYPNTKENGISDPEKRARHQMEVRRRASLIQAGLSDRTIFPDEVEHNENALAEFQEKSGITDRKEALQRMSYQTQLTLGDSYDQDRLRYNDALNSDTYEEWASTLRKPQGVDVAQWEKKTRTIYDNIKANALPFEEDVVEDEDPLTTKKPKSAVSQIPGI